MKQDAQDQDRGPAAKKVELEKRLDANRELEKKAAKQPLKESAKDFPKVG